MIYGLRWWSTMVSSVRGWLGNMMLNPCHKRGLLCTKAFRMRYMYGWLILDVLRTLVSSQLNLVQILWVPSLNSLLGCDTLFTLS